MIVAIPVREFTYAGAENRVFHVSKGYGLPFHQHEHNHAVACYAGACLVRVKGQERTLTKDSMPLDLPANEPHEIEALEDGTVFVNIFAKGKY